jgi:hypothetical protein
MRLIAECTSPSFLADQRRSIRLCLLLLRIDPMPARVRAAVQTRRDLTGRRWIILKGGNREGVLMPVSRSDGLWGFEHSRRGVK